MAIDYEEFRNGSNLAPRFMYHEQNAFDPH